MSMQQRRMNAMRLASSAKCAGRPAFAPPNVRNAMYSTVAPVPMMPAPRSRTTISA